MLSMWVNDDDEFDEAEDVVDASEKTEFASE
jgi:hypothetical protein